MDTLKKELKPEIRVFAGPNGSGKSTLTIPDNIIPPYINADDIQRENGCSVMEAAQQATALREAAVAERRSFTFETVLSRERNLILLQRAKDAGYFIRCAFVLTADPELNVERVKSRVLHGGHDVPADKIRSRYYRSLLFIPALCDVCDRLNIYDNTQYPVRIFKKRDDEMTVFASEIWSEDEILRLVTYGHK